MTTSRRKFIQQATQLTAGIGLTSLPFNILKHNVNDIVNVGLIGCNNMGWWDLRSLVSHEGTNCIAMCDVDKNVLDRRAAELNSEKGMKPKLYGDYRKMLENKDLDVVIIGTPDHWHSLQLIDACDAGLDVYIEKPIGNSIQQCDDMVAAVKRTNRIVQVGQWQRSDPHWISALEYLQTGQLGTIRTVKTWACTSYGRHFPPVPDSAVPAGVDYKMWLGPAPDRPFNKNRFHGSFRYFWDYAGGLMTDWGVHMIDMALAGMNVTSPEYVMASGGKFGEPDSAAETPDTLQAIYRFKDFTMNWEQSLGVANGPYNSNQPGVAFVGNNGTLVIDRSTWRVVSEYEDDSRLIEEMPVQESKANGLDHHTKNFLDCIKSRNPTNATIEMGAHAARNAQLGNISYRTGKQVQGY